MTLKSYDIDKTWTLFLDRDGVINRKLPDAYVLRWDEFEFIPGVTEALKIFAAVFGRIIVVTNQQCIGKGLLSELQLSELHQTMLHEINAAGGRIDDIIYATQLASDNHIDRKPNIGMGLKARAKYPEINFKRSLIAGDSKSDMEFGHKLDMVRVLINKDRSTAEEFPHLVNFAFDDLLSFAKQFNK